VARSSGVGGGDRRRGAGGVGGGSGWGGAGWGGGGGAWGGGGGGGWRSGRGDWGDGGGGSAATWTKSWLPDSDSTPPAPKQSREQVDRGYRDVEPPGDSPSTPSPEQQRASSTSSTATCVSPAATRPWSRPRCRPIRPIRARMCATWSTAALRATRHDQRSPGCSTKSGWGRAGAAPWRSTGDDRRAGARCAPGCRPAAGRERASRPGRVAARHDQALGLPLHAPRAGNVSCGAQDLGQPRSPRRRSARCRRRPRRPASS